jgi:arylsulfatase A-like enzyme
MLITYSMLILRGRGLGPQPKNRFLLPMAESRKSKFEIRNSPPPSDSVSDDFRISSFELRISVLQGGINRKSAIGLAALLALSVLCLSPRGQAQSSAAARHVVVISVDGMRASAYLALSPQPRIPNLLRLKAEGSFAEGVEGVYPTLTYPSHTTIVTGRMPAEHGIYTNLSSRQPGKNPHDWFWLAEAIKVPTLWDEAHRHHLTSGAVSWPVTVHAAIDWNVPEVWDPAKGPSADFFYLAKFMDPLVGAELLGALGPPQPGADIDTEKTRLAVHLIKAHKPNLMLVHLDAVDEAEHQHGPQSAEAAAALERVDARVGEILTAVKEAGLEGSTDVFVVSDHGFLPVERQIRPNVLLVKAGLLTADDRGEVTGGKLATVDNGGSFFVYWPEGTDLKSEVVAALRPLLDQGLLWGVLDRQALRDLAAEPAAQMALEAAEGTAFASSARGELVGRLEMPGGTHGYLPFRQGLEASFIAWGPDIKRGVDLHRVRMTRVGPTILKALGINDLAFGEQPALTDIFK